jgi:F0F1-type ATP synthase assembly protein I
MAARPESSPPNKKSSRYSGYLKYSGLAVQLLITIAACGWAGGKLDQYLHFKFPVFMLLFGLIGFSVVLYQVYKSVKQE